VRNGGLRQSESSIHPRTSFGTEVSPSSEDDPYKKQVASTAVSFALGCAFEGHYLHVFGQLGLDHLIEHALQQLELSHAAAKNLVHYVTNYGKLVLSMLFDIVLVLSSQLSLYRSADGSSSLYAIVPFTHSIGRYSSGLH